MIELRDYQRNALNALYAWFGEHQGNPCLEAPTGSGKSYLIAAFCKENLEANPGIRILMATHTKELIVQDAQALLNIWPEAPMGIYSAGLKRKENLNPITIGGIQSLYRHASDFGHIDVLLVDEAHMIPTSGTGMYLTFIDHLKQYNPDLTVIGFTATPYRLKHGMITDKPAIFDARVRAVGKLKDRSGAKHFGQKRMPRGDVREEQIHAVLRVYDRRVARIGHDLRVF